MTANTVKISIIIPAHNAASTVARTLDSVAAQDINELEIICVNDASTDGTFDIFHQYFESDSRIILLNIPYRKGTNFARKAAALTARGEYVMFLDADDVLMPHSCRIAYEKITESAADIFCFGTEIDFAADVSEDIKQHVANFLKPPRKALLHGNLSVLKAIFVDRLCTWNIWNKIYRTGLLKLASPYFGDKNVFFTEDYFSSFMIASFAGSMLIDDVPLYRYSCGKGISTAASSDERLAAMIPAYSLKDDLTAYCSSRSDLFDAKELIESICNFYDETFNRIAADCSDEVIYKLLKSNAANKYEFNKLLDLLYDRCRNAELWKENYEKVCRDYRNLEEGYKQLESAYLKITQQQSVDKCSNPHLLCEADKASASTASRNSFETALLSDTVYFDKSWYLERYSDLAAAKVDAVQHYLQHGAKENRDPSPYFSTQYYLSRVPGLAESGQNPLVHYLCYGKAQGIDCVPPQDSSLLTASGLFDPEYYLNQCPDRENVANPYEHYCRYGWKNGLNPSAEFNGSIYFANNPDVFELQTNPLAHYLRHGKSEGRSYKNVFGDTLPDIYTLLKESALFDENYYRSTYLSGLRSIDPLWHYILCGWKRGFNPSPDFWTQGYLKLYMDISEIQIPALYHYLKWGRYEGRESIPVKPAARVCMPDNFDIEKYSTEKNKVLLAVHSLDINGIPALARNIAESLRPFCSSAIISPFDGAYKDACIQQGIPVCIDPEFFISSERLGFYQNNGFGSCICLTVGVAGAFDLHADKIPSLMWVNDNVTAQEMPEHMRKKLAGHSNIYASSKLTRQCVSTYAPNVGTLCYPLKDLCAGEKKEFSSSQIRFAVLGRLEERKAQDLAIKAFGLLPENLRKNASLQIIGSATSPEYKEKLLQSAGNASDIIFGEASADQSVYHGKFKDIDVLICPSLKDPMPLVVTDAMMHGCPVIISDKVGQCDLIEDFRNGFVFESGNVEKLAQCMYQIIKNRSILPEMSANVRETFLQNHEYGKSVSEILEALNRAAKNISGKSQKEVEQ